MSIPNVFIAFDLSLAGAGAFFTIGETELGTGPPSLPLVGDALFDISEDVRSVSVRRGRSRETDKFDAGTATVVVGNEDRLYDPNFVGPIFNSTAFLMDDPELQFNGGGFGSPFAPSLIPRKALVVEASGQRVFTGQVEDIDLQYSMSKISETVFKAADGFSLLSQLNVSASAVSEELTGDRIGFILDDAQWPGLRRSINAGTATLASASITSDTNVIDYLNTVAASEPGFIYISRQGNFEFRDRQTAQVLAGVTFGDQPGDLRFSALELEYGTERLHTRIEVGFAGGTVVADNVPSQEKYGIDVLSVNTFLSTQTQAEALAEFYAIRFGEPETRVSQLEIPAHAYSADDLGRLLSLELGSLVQFRFTPNGIGDPVEQALLIESIEHNFQPGAHIIRLTLSEGRIGFVLDESRLDQDILGF
jgi:hypothetical protein